MIPVDLLFQVSHIRFLYGISLRDILFLAILSFCFSVALYFMHKYLTREKNVSYMRKIVSGEFPTLDDDYFEEKMAQYIRNIIGFPNFYADALTARELAYEKMHHPLINVLMEIESIEYQGKTLSQNERLELKNTIFSLKEVI